MIFNLVYRLYARIIGKMSIEDSLSSKILTDVRIIANIYNIINIAGSKAINSDFVKSTSNNVNIVKPNIVGVNRRTADCRGAKYKKRRNMSNSGLCIKSDEYMISFDENDIMIVGGAALNVYDYLLKDFKHRRGISAIEEYIKKKTSDIDIIWWPRLTSNVKAPNKSISNEIIVSTSEAIENLVTEFKKQLEIELNINIQLIRKLLIPYIDDISNDDILDFKINWIPIYPAGVHKLEIEFNIKGNILDLIDISIHDSGASQRFDINGNLINDLRYMDIDPVYCSPELSQTENSIHSFPINIDNTTSLMVRVPSIYSFIEQQMFAFDNLIRESQPKSLINYKRVEYIKLLLESWKNENKDDIYIIGTNIPWSLKHLDERQNYSIDKFRDKILKLCDIINSKDDKYIEKLCIRVFEPFKKDRIAELDTIYKQFDDTYQITRVDKYKKYKKQMFELRKKIDEIRTKYRNMSVDELIKITNILKNIRDTEEVNNILKQEHNIRANIIRMQQADKFRENEYRMQRIEKMKVDDVVRKVEQERIMPILNPQIPYPGSVYINTTPEGINVYMSHDGIKYLLYPTGYIVRLNPFTYRWETLPYGAHPQYGLPSRMYSLPTSQQSIIYNPQTSYQGYDLGRGGRNKTSRKKYRNNNNNKTIKNI